MFFLNSQNRRKPPKHLLKHTHVYKVFLQVLATLHTLGTVSRKRRTAYFKRFESNFAYKCVKIKKKKYVHIQSICFLITCNWVYTARVGAGGTRVERISKYLL